MKSAKGQSLIELLLVIGLTAIILPAILTGLVASRSGKVQQNQRLEAVALLKEAQEAIRNVREKGWVQFALNGTFYPQIDPISGTSWTLTPCSSPDPLTCPTDTNGFKRAVIITDVNRDASGTITLSGGTIDPSTKHIDTTVSWTQPIISSVSSTEYITRYLDNLSYIETTESEFNAGTKSSVAVTNTAGGEVQLADNTKAKWCSPSFSSSTIDLPDGPPVAVDAMANASISIPNDAFVATSPFVTSSVKLAYVNVTADTDPPVSSLRGTFTLDPSKYSDAGLVPSGINLTNSFKTNDVKYYKSASGKVYVLMATDLPDHEVIAIQVNNGTGDAFQDPVNKIYTYWTFFNTRIFNTSAGLDTGFISPTANAAVTSSAGDNNGFGLNPTRAYSDNASFAVDTNSGNGTGTNCTGSDKDKHLYYNYGFTIQSGATINGIEVRLDALVDNQTGAPQMCVQLSWDGGTSWTTAQSTTTLNTSEATYMLGGPTDTWGRTWSSSNFTNSKFRVRVINVASDTSRDFSLDWIPVKVHYSLIPSATNDQAPFDYGGTTITVLGDRGYVASGGYLYVIDLATIDSKSPTTELDQLGCRIQLHGFDCKPGSPAIDKKYSQGETGTTWSTNGFPAHNDCSDGGNIELFATNDLSGVNVGGSNYIFVAVGAGTNPEINIVNATNVPGPSSSPSINNSSCGRISGGNASWKMVGSKDFNSNSGTEEAANSVYAKSDGTRAYISSNGTSDSKQFYILNTENKTSPTFLSGTTLPTSGFYQGSGANGEMYPRRSLTVLNGQRAVLVGKDGVTNGNDAEEYQVLNSQTEATPTYCGGINFDQGFNDLTSVTEADLDNFVYMVANTTLNELKIIQGGPDGNYVGSGTYESPTFNPGYSTAFNRIMGTGITPANTTLQFQTAVADPIAGSCSGVSFNFTGPDGSGSTYYPTINTAMYINDDGSGYENPAQCFRYKAFLSTTDYNTTPILQDTTVNYSP